MTMSKTKLEKKEEEHASMIKQEVISAVLLLGQVHYNYLWVKGKEVILGLVKFH